jgi:hypothetical protein
MKSEEYLVAADKLAQKVLGSSRQGGTQKHSIASDTGTQKHSIASDTGTQKYLVATDKLTQKSTW